MILDICCSLYAYTSDTRINLISEVHYNDSAGMKHICSIILLTGQSLTDITYNDPSLRNVGIDTVKIITRTESYKSFSDAKQKLLNELLERCRHALTVPVKPIMEG